MTDQLGRAFSTLKAKARTAVFRPDGGPRFLRLSIVEQAFLIKRLALYLSAGVPILSALSLLREGAKGKTIPYILDSLSASVAEGETLAGALDPFRRIFGDFLIALVRIGEASGRLRETLEYLAHALRKQDVLRRKLIGALIYPCIIVIVTLGIASFLTLYAFPKIVPVFRGFDAALPFPTRLLIFVSDGLARHGILILAVFASIGIGIWLFMRRPAIRSRRDQLVLEVPILGNLLRAYYLAHIAHTLATLLGSGTRLAPALELAAATAKNRAYQQALTTAREHIMAGERLSDSFGASASCFPLMFVQMIRTGESAGVLAASFISLAEHHEEEVDDLSRNLTVLIEPALMILMGLLVGFVALAIITPVYQITQDMA